MASTWPWGHRSLPRSRGPHMIIPLHRALLRPHTGQSWPHQSCSMDLSLSHRVLLLKPQSEPPPWPWMTWLPPEITWASHDDHCHHAPPHWQAPSQWTWDWGFQPSAVNLFLSYSILMLLKLLAVSACIPAWILIQRPIACAPVPCSHPHLLHPHVDSHPSYRCCLEHVLIAYLCLRPCGSIPISSSLTSCIPPVWLS